MASAAAQQSAAVLTRKLEAYGYTVLGIDGHAPNEIRQAFDRFRENTEGAPIAVVARTVKGWGAPCVQGGGWHGKRSTNRGRSSAAARCSACSTAWS